MLWVKDNLRGRMPNKANDEIQQYIPAPQKARIGQPIFLEYFVFVVFIPKIINNSWTENKQNQLCVYRARVSVETSQPGYYKHC